VTGPGSEGLETVERLLGAGGCKVDAKFHQLLSSRTGDHSPSEQQRLKEEGTVWKLLDPALTGFFRCAAKGVAFASEDGIKRRYGQTLKENYPEAGPAFLRFATSFWTLKLLLDAQPPSWRETLAGYVLGQVELNVSGLFFPTRTPQAVQRVAERELAQRQTLANFPELYDVDEFMRGNPILLRDKSHESSRLRLTRQQNPREIQKYEHIRPAPVFGPRRCLAPFPGGPYTCTLAPGHSGPHVAHGGFLWPFKKVKVMAVWDDGP